MKKMSSGTPPSIGHVTDTGRVGLIAFVLAALAAGHVMQDAVSSRYLGAAWSESFTGASSYGRIAEEWVDTGTLDNFRPPAYPVFLALNVAVWGHDSYVPSAVVLQALTAWATLVGLFLVARRATGRAAWGLVAVGLVALTEFWVVETIHQRETFLYSAVLTALVGVMVYARSWSPRACAAAGALCALGWLTRPTGAVLLPILLGMMWRDRHGRGRPSAQAALVLALTFGLPLLVWAGHQHARHGTVAISGKSGSFILLSGNNRALAEIYPFIDVDRLGPFLDRVGMEASARGADPDRARYRHALRFMLGSPLDSAALLPRKLAAFFLPIQFPLGSGTIHQTPDGHWRIEDYVPTAIRGEGIMALPGVVAFFAALRWWRGLPPSGLFILLAVGCTALIHLVTFAETRYRLPYDPLMALLFVQMAAAVTCTGVGRDNAREGWWSSRSRE